MIIDSVDLLEICDKLVDVKDCTINQESFYFHMWNGIRDNTIFPYVSYKDKRMTGCVVFSLDQDLNDTILSLIFIWIDKSCPKLWKEYLKFAGETAKKLGANKMQINTSRNPKVLERRLGKYGFAQKYVIFEKDVK